MLLTVSTGGRMVDVVPERGAQGRCADGHGAIIGGVDWRLNGVRVVRAGELDPNTPQTPGMHREAAIDAARAGAEKLWAGTVVIHPDAKTGSAPPRRARVRDLRRQRPRADALGRAARVHRRGGPGRLHLRAALRPPPGDQCERRLGAVVRGRAERPGARRREPRHAGRRGEPAGDPLGRRHPQGARAARQARGPPGDVRDAQLDRRRLSGHPGARLPARGRRVRGVRRGPGRQDLSRKRRRWPRCSETASRRERCTSRTSS